MGLLDKTKCTVIGAIQYADGRRIREYFTQELGKIGVVVYDHYHKPFIDDTVQENEKIGDQLKKWMADKNFDEIYKRRSIRTYDLSLIDRSDFIIFHYIPGIITVGSWEEFFSANYKKRPIFFITEGGVEKTPLWAMWTIKPKYFYNSKEEVVEMLRKIDNGDIKMDSDRWRLLKKEFR